jgi:hypothetical protein
MTTFEPATISGTKPCHAMIITSPRRRQTLRVYVDSDAVERLKEKSWYVIRPRTHTGSRAAKHPHIETYFDEEGARVATQSLAGFIVGDDINAPTRYTIWRDGNRSNYMRENLERVDFTGFHQRTKVGALGRGVVKHRGGYRATLHVGRKSYYLDSLKLDETRYFARLMFEHVGRAIVPGEFISDSEVTALGADKAAIEARVQEYLAR